MTASTMIMAVTPSATARMESVEVRDGRRGLLRLPK
jgi:hypothetical protein